MSHPLDLHQFRPGNRRRSPPAANVAHPVRQAMNRQRGNADLAQPLRPVPGSHRRHALPGRPRRIMAAVVGKRRASRNLLFIAWRQGRANNTHRPHHPPNHFLARNRPRPRKQFPHRFRRSLAHPRLSPVVAIIDVKDRPRSGCAIAIVCPIWPPIDAPTMCASAMPGNSGNPTASAAMSGNVYVTEEKCPASAAERSAAGASRKCVERPEPRLSKRIACSPPSTRAWQNESGQ